jgi:hypothetical protein
MFLLENRLAPNTSMLLTEAEECYEEDSRRLKHEATSLIPGLGSGNSLASRWPSSPSQHRPGLLDTVQEEPLDAKYRNCSNRSRW